MDCDWWNEPHRGERYLRYAPKGGDRDRCRSDGNLLEGEAMIIPLLYMAWLVYRGPRP